MSKKLATIDLKGNAYAKVATRILEFRELCPNGLIETAPKFIGEDKVSFSTRILKDKSNKDSGEGTGSSYGKLVDAKGIEVPKAFEKLETISIGRALAVLGFMSSGEVASFEEMEEFLSEKDIAKQDRIREMYDEIDAIDNVKTLREYYKTYREGEFRSAEFDDYITAKGEVLKAANKEDIK